MKISQEFPSQYLKASDLGGREIRVTMGRVEREEIGTDKKLVLYFQGKDKGMVLNKTNANNIASLYGPETEDWQGKRIMLTVAWVDFQGRSVEALRVRPPAKTGGAQKQEAPLPREMADMDDEIPF